MRNAFGSRSREWQMYQLQGVPLIQRRLEGYGKGIYTFLEVASEIFETVTAQDIHELMRIIPDDFAKWLQCEANSAPTDDEGWQRLQLFHIESSNYSTGFEPSNVDEQVEGDELAKVRYRERIEILRRYFSGQTPRDAAAKPGGG